MPSSNLISPEALLRCNETVYWKLVTQQCHMLTDGIWRINSHVRAFAQYVLLTTSVFGSFCWPRAITQVTRHTVWNLSPLLNESQPPKILDNRDGLPYPITVAPVVQYAGLLLLSHVVRPSSNHKEISLTTKLAPRPPKGQRAIATYRQELIQDYLQELCDIAEINPAPSVGDYLSVGRFLLAIHVYELDVLYTTLGGLKTGIPLPNQQDRLLDKLIAPSKFIESDHER